MDFESSQHLNIHSSEEDLSLISESSGNNNNNNNISSNSSSSSGTISNISSTSDIIGSITSSKTTDNEVFEIRDFSTLSSWEKLIDKFEQLILAWFNRFSNFQFTPTETFFYKSHIIQFNGTKYLFSYYNFNQSSLSEEEHDHQIEKDFLHRSHHLTRWFGVKEFFIISLYNNNNNNKPSSLSPFHSYHHSNNNNNSSNNNSNNSSHNNSNNISIQSSTSLSSALSVSLSNLNKNEISYFILLNNECLNYNGRLNSKNNQVTKYKSESLYEKQLNSSYITSSLMKLSGMIDLFCINLGKHIRITNELTIKSRYTFILPYLNNEQVEEEEEWKDSGFEILSDHESVDLDEEYFEIENDENLELKENIIKIIEISPGKEIKIPKTQNPPQNTEDVIEEEREILSNMISSDQRIRFQCEGLISDMQAFKFVNPGCEFSDFLLWYSPKDVKDENLSSRMKMNENIWKKFWEESKPLPISKQKQIFDHKLQAEKIIHQIETMDFDIILQQLMICTLTGHYYMLKEWWIDLIMDSTDIFSNEFKQVDKKLDLNLPLIRIVESKFLKTKEDLKLLSNNRLQDNNVILQCVENIQDLELSISIILSIISKISIQGRKSFMEIYNSSQFLLISLENLLINSQDYIQFNNTNNNNTNNTDTNNANNNNNENINESICEFINDQLDSNSNNNNNNNNIERVSEFILRCTAQRPYLISEPTQQLMYALISRDEIRVSTALTEKVPW
ncbi:predicted protein [Naegleria gruberi]|uniref:Rab3 GTPase-activating protein catalytic subunit n=1 Tax=Naegleria gruberi TaxID=5762 RepID=D2V817_NAEGR|nr:uncharacterized protein NAEGRDRAFT_64996 [Naegleria gruberi]EFC46966.1 predicted protein [Naegleria gruberi]|eukprot:XP_002679710.1 predicted protein [Naegleria gruberi strain NEG-M]